MGYTAYSSVTRGARVAATKGISPSEYFERGLNNAMNPFGVGVRESRDSEAHPESVAIVLALDVTGSMGSIPNFLRKDGLTHIMQTIIDAKILHPQLLFLAVGDHTCDSAPLQVGQFESGDELLDHWLKTVWLEGAGGGNDGESYLLAWYFAAYHTAIDCMEKRNRKGLLFTIGDEPCLPSVSASVLKKLMGPGQYPEVTAAKVLEEARKKYECYHLNMQQTQSGGRSEVARRWVDLIGSDHFMQVGNSTDVGKTIGQLVVNSVRGATNRVVRPRRRAANE